MVKKILVLLLSIFIVLSLCSCFTKSNNDNTNDKNNKNIVVNSTATSSDNTVSSDDIVGSGNALNGEVEKITDFSAGRAFVKIKDDNEKNYCINKKGEVLFEIDPVIFTDDNNYSATTSGFYNGVTLITDIFAQKYIMVCDENGKCTTAEELGVTSFFDDALNDGYIITFTDGKSGEKDKFGILNARLEWVVQPSESLVKTMDCPSVAYGGLQYAPYYENYILYGYNGSVDVRNGEVIQDTYRTHGKDLAATFSKNWYPGDSGYYYGNPYEAVLMLDFYALGIQEQGIPIAKVEGADFINGKAPVVLSNGSKSPWFTLIDESGNVLFERVDFGENIKYIHISGNYVLVVGEMSSSTTFKTYDLSGKLIGEWVFDGSAAYSFEDEVIILRSYTRTSSSSIVKNASCYDVNFNKLF